MAPDTTTGRDPPQRREARFAKRRCALHPGGLLPGCQERRPRRDRGGATGTVAASQGFASGMEVRQGGDSFAGFVHDSPPHQGDARKSHKQKRNGKKRKKKKNNNKHGNHRKITSEKNIPDTSQTGRVTGDASAWPASLQAGVSLPGGARGLTGGHHRLPCITCFCCPVRCSDRPGKQPADSPQNHRFHQ